MDPQTPYYLIDESKLVNNLEKIKYLRDEAGVKSVLALKCFSTWAVFDLMKDYMDGTTSSSLFEARLGHEKFGKEVHAYSVAFSDNDIQEVKKFATKIIFNSLSQLKRYHNEVKHLKVGLRVNPGVSSSDFDLADPARRYSRLGEVKKETVTEGANLISGVMFHCHCENEDFNSFCSILETIEKNYGDLLKKLQWVSLGGGIYFTKNTYPLEKFAKKLKEFRKKYEVDIYLEPGESAITESAYLVTKVLDIVHNEKDIAIVDGSIEAHMLDLLIYRTDAKMENGQSGDHEYIIAGKTCLAGDVFGTFWFPKKLEIGNLVQFADAAGYTMVKKNWFNGLQMPSIVIKNRDGSLKVARKFSYEDFKNSLS